MLPKLIYSLTVLFFINIKVFGKQTRIPVGVLLGPEDHSTVTLLRLYDHETRSNTSSFKIDFITEKVDWMDSYNVGMAVCRLLSRGIFALVGPSSTESYPTLASYTNKFQVPFISPSFPKILPSAAALFGVSVQPETSLAVLDIIRFYKWTAVVYLYDREDGPERLQNLLDLTSGITELEIKELKRIASAQEANNFLRQIELSERESIKHIILDVTPALAKNLIVNVVNDVTIEKRNFHFLLVHPTVDEFWTELRGVNITGFRLVNTEDDVFNKFLERWKRPEVGNDQVTVEAVLIYDGLYVLHSAISSLLADQPNILQENLHDGKVFFNGTAGINCFQDPSIVFEHGPVIAQYVKQIHLTNALTKNVEFDANGHRRGYTLDIMETVPTGHSQVGTWSDVHGLQIVRTPLLSEVSYEHLTDKVVVISSILEEPYLMLKEPVSENPVFEGYCKDLADLLAKKLNFKYKLQLVKDGKYGSKIGNSSDWDGMVGELVRREVDMVIAPLTVTSQRAQVIHFTKSFMTVGIAMLAKKPVPKAHESPFFFFQPFSYEIWICLCLAYFGMSILLFISCHFTTPPEKSTFETNKLKPCFTFSTSLWITLASLFFRNTGICAKSVSTRIVHSIWWFFTFILVVVYIASISTYFLAQQLRTGIITGRDTPYMHSIHDILHETVTEGYPNVGILESGSTLSFNSKLPLIERMHEYFVKNPDMTTNTIDEGIDRVRQGEGSYVFLTESSTLEYVSHHKPCDTMVIPGELDQKPFAVALPLGSPLIHNVDIAVLSFQETGELARLYQKWWEGRSECATTIKRRSFKENYYGSLTLFQVSGLFYILLAGIIACLIITFIEFFFQTRQEAHLNNMPLQDVMRNRANKLLGSERRLHQTDPDDSVLQPES
ncbi:glutamate receptor-like [Tachypleus tridentatus]|uniref:glutamate receptor-like n=1 Tax=Tachypleus tridentatus TaxID=6853 RepID=UPI003FD198B6